MPRAGLTISVSTKASQKCRAWFFWKVLRGGWRWGRRDILAAEIIREPGRACILGQWCRGRLLLYFGFLFSSSFPAGLTLDAVSELTIWDVNRSHDVVQEKCGTNVDGWRIQTLSPLQLFANILKLYWPSDSLQVDLLDGDTDCRCLQNLNILLAVTIQG